MEQESNVKFKTTSKTIWILSSVIFASLLFIDQWSKYLAIKHLKNQNPVSLIKDVFELYYLENNGAAWGILADKQVFLIGVTVIVLFIIIYIYNKIPSCSKYLLLRACFIMIVSGAAGNMIDRIKYHYVIDYFYFKLIDFPVFNAADIYVTVGAFLLIIALIFVYDESELAFT